MDSVSVKTTTTLGSATILYKGTANDYYDFKTNGNLHYKLNTEEDILPYSILSNTWLLVDGDSAQIISLSNNRLHVYQKDVKNSTDYVETTAWFRR
ncbi:MAG: hypothetical protein EOP53_18470 [Sphingobacteriales bacterium]|nr:MAG: hypothetical protein EOP53_18470 [Sphingobacteriales bacterium]